MRPRNGALMISGAHDPAHSPMLGELRALTEQGQGRHPRHRLRRGAGPRPADPEDRPLKTLERLGLAQERQQGVWQLDGKLESKLRRLGDRADEFRTMQQVLKELGIERGAAAMALFERGPRKVPLIGKVIGVGMVDEITDRTWVVVDGVDGRVHYADLGRLKPADVPQRGMLVALAGDETLRGRPTSVPCLEVMSETEIRRLCPYDGPTWLDGAIVSKLQVNKETLGFAADLRQALADRGHWLAERGLADLTPANEVVRQRKRCACASLPHHDPGCAPGISYSWFVRHADHAMTRSAGCLNCCGAPVA